MKPLDELLALAFQCGRTHVSEESTQTMADTKRGRISMWPRSRKRGIPSLPTSESQSALGLFRERSPVWPPPSTLFFGR